MPLNAVIRQPSMAAQADPDWDRPLNT